MLTLDIMKVTWIKNTQNSQWFDLLRLNLSAPYFTGKLGVYVIWYASPQSAKVIYVGSGAIGERLVEHRSNPEISKYSQYGQLKVSWALMDDPTTMTGVEAFLAHSYSPIIGERSLNVDPIEVNLIGK
jgi:hypothetical protein